MRPGLPPRWEEIAAGVRTTTGRELLLRAPEEPFSHGPQSIEVYLDRELLGQFAFWWDDQDDADDVLSELRAALAAYLDEELRIEDW